jgi:hypothetical protein
LVMILVELAVEDVLVVLHEWEFDPVADID